jgi:hypothetical protein
VPRVFVVHPFVTAPAIALVSRLGRLAEMDVLHFPAIITLTIRVVLRVACTGEVLDRRTEATRAR